LAKPKSFTSLSSKMPQTNRK